jgi:hypothetical protein
VNARAYQSERQNLRSGRYELAIDTPSALRDAAAFAELAQAI